MQIYSLGALPSLLGVCGASKFGLVVSFGSIDDMYEAHTV